MHIRSVTKGKYQHSSLQFILQYRTFFIFTVGIIIPAQFSGFDNAVPMCLHQPCRARPAINFGYNLTHIRIGFACHYVFDFLLILLALILLHAHRPSHFPDQESLHALKGPALRLWLLCSCVIHGVKDLGSFNCFLNDSFI